MQSGNTVSYKNVVDKVFRDFGFNYDINDEVFSCGDTSSCGDISPW